MSRRVLVTALMCAGLAGAGCGGSESPSNQIRANFGRLQRAIRDRDAHTVCELLFPFGEHQGRGALTADLVKLDSTRERSRYEASIAQCTRTVHRTPINFGVYETVYGKATIGNVDVHGRTASVRLSIRGRGLDETFVDAAGEWRLLIGVQ
jgi:hypothetical protein